MPQLSEQEKNTVCGQCGGICCNYIGFPIVAEEEYFYTTRGIEVISRERMKIAVMMSTCHHLTGGKCGLYGSDRRPKECSAWRGFGLEEKCKLWQLENN